MQNHGFANEHAEKVVAGCCLLGPDEVDAGRAIVGPDDFGHHPSRLVFEAAVALRERGQPPDAAAVLMALKAAGTAADLGPHPGVFLFDLHEQAPTAANLDYAARLVRESAVRRRVAALAGEMMRAAADPGTTVDELLDGNARRLLALADDGPDEGGPVAFADLIAAALDRYDAAQASGAPAVLSPTGFAALDGYLGGFRAGQLVVVGARPSVGKSALATRFAVAAASRGVGTLVFSLEMGTGEVTDRIVGAEASVQLPRLQGTSRFDEAQPGRILALAQRAKAEGWPLYVDDRAGRTAEGVAAVSRRYARRQGVRIVVVDYLQLLKPADPREPRTLQVGAMSRRLKQLAREAGVCVVALAQLNRAVEGRADAKPKLSDLRDSGEVEQDADVVLLLHRIDDAPDAASHRVDVVIAKNRNGPIATAPLQFARAFARFEDREPVM